MKSLIFISLFFLNNLASYSQSVAINKDGSTPDPSAMLDVKSTTQGMLIPRMTSAQRIAIASPAVGLLVFDNETNNFWFNAAAGWTELTTGGGGGGYWSANGSNIFNNNAGNVGIGTNTPAEKLTLQTPINTRGWIHAGQVAGVDSIIVGEAIGGVSAAVGTFTDHAFRLTAGTLGLGKVQIYPDGNVVVGDNNVAPFGRFTVRTPNNSYGISHTSNEGNILATRIGGTSAGIGTFTNTHMRIFANGISAITITGSTGNVGIGIDFPANKFEVNGTMRSKEVIVESINWPDYVFDENYKLPLLSDVEEFIHQNKHLPNVPSAAEIGQKGLHLGDTQKRMMEKIEELTLYVIELDKKIKLLEEKNIQAK
jgi:hypothetical protein